jgi:DNA-binding LacI/PurR family transcriptional regulator
MATLGVQLLLDILAGKTLVQPQIVVEPTLIVRQSTSRVREQEQDEMG